ncbi:DNA mismatch repair protein MutT [Saccharobesus litoralis]|uniref:DNA mismatch repair protein MutT n=1 Tax=Saccharobesus litoralis TaxID=2172099 RepID=A0A2S0VPT5_9ALTE|nr:NUDIX domain-containing protein [Saccharobesus litoralis]AWB66235.1 DNA mismatch repair protein MutT [Saccharobesus litoralis]
MIYGNTQLLDFKYDPFNGVIIDSHQLPKDVDEFTESLLISLDTFQQHGKQLVWLTLTHEQALFIPICTEQGFVFHNCLEQEITLILRLQPNAYAPFVPTHSIGAGALVINDNNQILLVKDSAQKVGGFKLPGGHVELSEDIAEAAMRETEEETGIKTEFEALMGFGTKHPYRFGKSNIYFICKLKPLNKEIIISQPDEILDARWLDIDSFLADETNSEFNRTIVAKLAKAQGLKRFDKPLGSTPRNEIFLAEHK